MIMFIILTLIPKDGYCEYSAKLPYPVIAGQKEDRLGARGRVQGVLISGTLAITPPPPQVSEMQQWRKIDAPIGYMVSQATTNNYGERKSNTPLIIRSPVVHCLQVSNPACCKIF